MTASANDQESNVSVLTMTAIDDVDTLIRILQPFAVQGARSLRLNVTPRARRKCRIRIETRTLSAAQTSLLTNRLGNIHGVERLSSALHQVNPGAPSQVTDGNLQIATESRHV